MQGQEKSPKKTSTLKFVLSRKNKNRRLITGGFFFPKNYFLAVVTQKLYPTVQEAESTGPLALPQRKLRYLISHLQLQSSYSRKILDQFFYRHTTMQ